MIDSDEIINGVRFQTRKYSFKFQQLLYSYHLPLNVSFLISGNSQKELLGNCQNGDFLQKNIFTFGTAKTKCQQRAQVFQLIWIDLNPFKMIENV